jgi:metal-responsive CopG/Arc/MetJ family transcriptional regulator
MNRGSVRVKSSVFVGLWVPKTLVEQIDAAVRATDSDRSKVIRLAVRDHIRRLETANRVTLP